MNACKVCIGYVIRCSCLSGKNDRCDVMQSVERGGCVCSFVCLIQHKSFGRFSLILIL